MCQAHWNIGQKKPHSPCSQGLCQFQALQRAIYLKNLKSFLTGLWITAKISCSDVVLRSKHTIICSRSEKFDWALAAGRVHKVFAGVRRLLPDKIQIFHFCDEGLQIFSDIFFHQRYTVLDELHVRSSFLSASWRNTMRRRKWKEHNAGSDGIV